MRPGASASRERGFALVIVLWTIVLLSLIVMRIAAVGRTEAQIARNIRVNAAGESAADGAVFQAIFRLLDRSDQHWTADGSTRTLVLPHGVAQIRVEDEADKVNPNVASPELLAALLRELGASAPEAARLAAAIVDWRSATTAADAPGPSLADYRSAGRDVGPPGTPFQSLEEVGDVLGMTPDVLARLLPHLTLFNPSDPAATSSDPVVARSVIAVTKGPGNAVPFDDRISDYFVTITVDVVTDDGARSARRALVEILPIAARHPYRILVGARGTMTEATVHDTGRS